MLRRSETKLQIQSRDRHRRAAPPSPVIAALEPMGFEVIHLYGLTEVYGPATICAWQKSWDDLDLEGRCLQESTPGSGLSFPEWDADW